jgi:hypothetical protein
MMDGIEENEPEKGTYWLLRREWRQDLPFRFVLDDGSQTLVNLQTSCSAEGERSWGL